MSSETTSPTIPSTRPEIREQVDTLIGLLREQLTCARRVASLVKKRLLAEARGNFALVEECLECEREALLKHALAERERIAALAEIGQILEVRNPSRLRLAQLIFYVSPEVRDELLDLREELRDIADELSGLRAWGSKLEHHSLGSVTLFLSPDLSEEKSRRWLIEHLRDSEARAELKSIESALEQTETSWRNDG